MSYDRCDVLLIKMFQVDAVERTCSRNVYPSRSDARQRFESVVEVVEDEDSDERADMVEEWRMDVTNGRLLSRPHPEPFCTQASMFYRSLRPALPDSKAQQQNTRRAF